MDFEVMKYPPLTLTLAITLTLALASPTPKLYFLPHLTPVTWLDPLTPLKQL